MEKHENFEEMSIVELEDRLELGSRCLCRNGDGGDGGSGDGSDGGDGGSGTGEVPITVDVTPSLPGGEELIPDELTPR